VKGLVAPEKGIILNNILIRGVPPSHDADVFFKATIKDEQEKDQLRDHLANKLRNILQVYGLITGAHAEAMPGSSLAKISDYPFGDMRLRGDLRLIPVFDEERRRREIPLLEKTMAKYGLIKHLFESKKKGFLRNAIDYYNRSLGDVRLEERLIDLMISLESLFSKEREELGLRYALRTSFLLSVGNEEELPSIFRNIKSLYRKRSKVVHGTEVANLDIGEITTFQKQVREAIKRLVHIEMDKEKFLGLLDESVVDKEKRKQLTDIVSKAIEKW